MAEAYNDWNDLIPLAQETLSVGGTPVALTGARNTKEVRIKVFSDLSGGATTYIGSSGVTTTNGFPLFNSNAGVGSKGDTPEFIVKTTRPEQFYLVATTSGVDVRVLYLG